MKSMDEEKTLYCLADPQMLNRTCFEKLHTPSWFSRKEGIQKRQGWNPSFTN